MSLYCWGISCSHPSDSPIFNLSGLQVFGGGWADSVRLLDNQDRRKMGCSSFRGSFFGWQIILPSGNLTWLLKMTIYSGFSHEKLWFSIDMLVYQRLRGLFFGADVFLGEFISWSAKSGAVFLEGTRIESGPGRKDSYIRDWFPELWDTPWYRRWALIAFCAFCAFWDDVGQNCRGNDWSVTAATLESVFFFFSGTIGILSLFFCSLTGESSHT